MSSSAPIVLEDRWDETPVYLAAIARTVFRGGAGTYEDSRKDAFTARDKTNFTAGQATWSEDNYPDILKVEKPPAGWKAWANNHESQAQMYPWGNPRTERWPEPHTTARTLREFPVLPKQIFTGEPGWVLEAWMRLDPTITYEDIRMRMHIDSRPSAQELEMRRARARNDLDLQFWEVEVTHEHDPRYKLFLSQLPSQRLTHNFRTMKSKGKSNQRRTTAARDGDSSPEVPLRARAA